MWHSFPRHIRSDEITLWRYSSLDSLFRSCMVGRGSLAQIFSPAAADWWHCLESILRGARDSWLLHTDLLPLTEETRWKERNNSERAATMGWNNTRSLQGGWFPSDWRRLRNSSCALVVLQSPVTRPPCLCFCVSLQPIVCWWILQFVLACAFFLLDLFTWLRACGSL